MKSVEIYTDGACSGNPGPGGWAAVLIYKNTEKEISGYYKDTTNNRMELFAVIEALGALKEPCAVTVHTDSAYVYNALSQGWLDQWKRQGWHTKSKDAVKNQDLWNLLSTVLAPHRIKWVKVKGHADDKYNNRCDELAVGAIKKNVK